MSSELDSTFDPILKSHLSLMKQLLRYQEELSRNAHEELVATQKAIAQLSLGLATPSAGRPLLSLLQPPSSPPPLSTELAVAVDRYNTCVDCSACPVCLDASSFSSSSSCCQWTTPLLCLIFLLLLFLCNCHMENNAKEVVMNYQQEQLQAEMERMEEGVPPDAPVCAICRSHRFMKPSILENCGHVFCGHCIEATIARFHRCPLWQQKANKKHIRRIFFS